jgi:cobalt-zinc-cadmium resistance protein CzcA
VGSKQELVDAIRTVLEEFPGVAYGFTQPIEMRTAEMLTGTRGDVAVKLFGPDLTELSAKADEIAAVLRSIEGSEDVFVARNSGIQYLNVAVDRTAAGRLDLQTAELQRILRAQIEGVPIGIVQEGVRRTPLVIRAGEDVRGSAHSFAELPLTLGDGRSVP